MSEGLRVLVLDDNSAHRVLALRTLKESLPEGAVRGRLIETHAEWPTDFDPDVEIIDHVLTPDGPNMFPGANIAQLKAQEAPSRLVILKTSFEIPGEMVDVLLRTPNLRLAEGAKGDWSQTVRSHVLTWLRAGHVAERRRASRVVKRIPRIDERLAHRCITAARLVPFHWERAATNESLEPLTAMLGIIGDALALEAGGHDGANYFEVELVPNVPWEAMLLPRERMPISYETPLVRTVKLSKPRPRAQLRLAAPTSVLHVVGGALDIGGECAECRSMKGALAWSACDVRCIPMREFLLSDEDVRDVSVVHVTMHNARPLPPEWAQLTSAISARRPRLVVLAACDSLDLFAREPAYFGATLRDMFERHLDGLVATQFLLERSQLADWSGAFYSLFGLLLDLGIAVAGARMAVAKKHAALHELAAVAVAHDCSPYAP